MKTYGLVGKSLDHSFSKKYFIDKFNSYNIQNVEYINIEIENINHLFNHPKFSLLSGFNITIPYKQSIIPFLDKIDPIAKTINAVNCVNIENQQLVGYNTDYIGFKESLKPWLKLGIDKALILGQGGASKAVSYALQELNIKYRTIARNTTNDFSSIHQKTINAYPLIVNCTPLGSYPNISSYPPLPYHFLSQKHLLYDLIYNPKETLFLKKGKSQNTFIQNGYEMLTIQAEKSWEIWSN